MIVGFLDKCRQVCTRFVRQYYLYLRDQEWGRLFLRICPYFPFNARVCVNQHEWLARQLQGEGIFFRKTSNAFVQCAEPERLQHLADGLSAADLEVPIKGWLRELVPFYASSDPNHTSDAARLRICVLFLKLFNRVYGPLAAALLKPVAHDAVLPDDRRAALDHLYAAVERALDGLLDHLGFGVAA